MAKTVRYVDSTFTPGEAEKITGVSTDLQRDWRRRGIIPSEGNGWTQHTPTALARLMFLSMMSRIGRDPKAHVDTAVDAEIAYATRILYFALRYPGAIENNTDVKCSADDVLRFSGRGNIAHRFFVIGHNGQTALVDDPRIIFDDERIRQVAASIVDLQALGALMAALARRPLMTVAVSDEETEEEKRAAYAARVKAMPMLDRKARRARGEAERAKLAEAMKPVKPKGKKK